jgi:hypothetical protein
MIERLGRAARLCKFQQANELVQDALELQARRVPAAAHAAILHEENSRIVALAVRLFLRTMETACADGGGEGKRARGGCSLHAPSRGRGQWPPTRIRSRLPRFSNHGWGRLRRS